MKKWVLIMQWALMMGLVAACTTDDEPGLDDQGAKQGYAT